MIIQTSFLGSSLWLRLYKILCNTLVLSRTFALFALIRVFFYSNLAELIHSLLLLLIDLLLFTNLIYAFYKVEDKRYYD